MLHGLPTDRPQIGGSWPPRAVSGTSENNLIIITIWLQQKELHDETKTSERLQLCTGLFIYLLLIRRSGFGGLGVACWPLVPKFAGSNPAEAVGFLRAKNPQHAFFRRGSKAVGPMS